MSNVEYQDTVENLKLKLSLKKQIWTGITCSAEQKYGEKVYRPLSWGVPPIAAKKQMPLDENEELLM